MMKTLLKSKGSPTVVGYNKSGGPEPLLPLLLTLMFMLVKGILKGCEKSSRAANFPTCDLTFGTFFYGLNFVTIRFEFHLRVASCVEDFSQLATPEATKMLKIRNLSSVCH